MTTENMKDHCSTTYQYVINLVLVEPKITSSEYIEVSKAQNISHVHNNL
jgi:hypothetical protein